MCDWLWVATAFIKRRDNSSTSTWGEEIYDESLRAMLEDTVRRVKHNDPAKRRWDVVSRGCYSVGGRKFIGIVLSWTWNLFGQSVSGPTL